MSEVSIDTVENQAEESKTWGGHRQISCGHREILLMIRKAA